MPWDKSNIASITNLDDPIERWSTFLQKAPSSVLNAIRFTMDLSRQLHEARIANDVSPTEPILTRDNWMLLAEMRPSDDNFDDFDDIECDPNHNWLAHAGNYTTEENTRFRNWVEQQKSVHLDINDDELSTVQPQNLNIIQHFAYNLINKFKCQKKQLLLIINGTAGIFIYSKLFFYISILNH